MPRYYCDYCDTYLTHDSPSVRKQHNSGYKHKANVRSYYQQFEEQQTQSLIDQKIKEHLGQTAAFSQVGGVFNQHLNSFPPRPRPPMLPPPNMAMPPGMRPPMFPQPIPGMPGVYGSGPMMPPMISPPGASSNGMPRLNLPTMSAPPTTPGMNSSNGGAPPLSLNMPVMYQQVNPTTPPPSGGGGGGFDGYNPNPNPNASEPMTTTGTAANASPQDGGYSFSQASENNH